MISRTKIFTALGILLLMGTSLKADESSTAQSNLNMDQLSQELNDLQGKVTALEEKSQGASLEVHGFAEFDAYYDDTQSFQETVGEGGVKLPGTIAGSNGLTQFSDRNTRLDVLGQMPVGNWKTKGYVEGDFLGYEGSGPSYGTAVAGTNDAALPTEYKYYTQPTFRLRHAYVEAQDTDNGFEIVAGQWWSLFGWNMDYLPAKISVNPDMGILFNRIPQLRLEDTLNHPDWTLQVAADVEKGNEDQALSPNINAGVRLYLNKWKGRYALATGTSRALPLSIGISETNAEYVWSASPTASTGETDNNVWCSAVALDTLIPIIPSDDDGLSLVFTGETTYGGGDLEGFNGGGFDGLHSLGMLSGPGSSVYSNTDPGVLGLDANNNLAVVALESWNAQLQLSLPRSTGAILSAGFGDLFSPNVQTLVNTPGFAANAVYNSDIDLFANVVESFTPKFRMGFEYVEFATNYLAWGSSETGPNATAYDHRVELTSWYVF